MSANKHEFMDVNIQLPGAEKVQIVDKKGNLVQSKNPEPQSKALPTTSKDVPNPDKEFYRKKKQQKIIQLQKLMGEKDRHINK